MAKVTTCSTLGYANFDLETALKHIAERGFKKVELAHMRRYCRHYILDQDNPRMLKALLDQYGLELAAVNYSTGWTEDRKEDLLVPQERALYISKVKQLFEEFAEVGAPRMNVPMGRRVDESQTAERIAVCAEVADELGEIARSHGMLMTLEAPHCFDFYYNLDWTTRLFKKITSPHVGALIDCSHWTVLKFDLEKWFDGMGDKLFHVHLRDARGDDTADFNQELEFTAGKGDCDFRAFGDWLDRHDYDKEISIEFEYRQDHMTLDKVENEYDDGLAYLSSIGWTFPESVRIPTA